MSEIIKIISFLSDIGLTQAIVLVPLFYILLRRCYDASDRANRLKALYLHRSLVYVKDKLDSLEITIYNTFYNRVLDIECDYKQLKLLIYRLTLGAALKNVAYNIVKEAILNNGYHEIAGDPFRFDEYIRNKGELLYNSVYDYVMSNTRVLNGPLKEHIGDNYSEEEASELFKDIIMNSIENDIMLQKKLGG